jgi:molecular chaperone DnaJ
MYGHDGLSNTGFGGFTRTEDVFSAFSGIFEDIFGFSADARRRRAPNGPEPGNDLRFDLVISFEEAALGVEKDISIERLETCGECNGSGAEKDSQRITCPSCGGSGEMVRSQGFFRIATTCSDCNGKGWIITKPCKFCRGKARVMETHKIKVKIPGGVDTGSRLRLRDEGEAGLRGGHRGDLYIFIQVEPHDFYQRKDNHIYCQIPISFVQAAMGDEVEVPTLYGTKTVKIPPGTQAGSVFHLSGSGVTDLRTRRKGDQIIEIMVITPENLTERQKELLEEFAAIEKEKKDTGFFKKLFQKVGINDQHRPEKDLS